jgi:hypothetical protein
MSDFPGWLQAGLLRLDWMLLVVAAWLLIGLAGVLALRRFTFVARILFPLGGALGLALLVLALPSVFAPPQAAVLPIGLPDAAVPPAPRQPVGLLPDGDRRASAGVSASPPATSARRGHAAGLLCLEYHVFLASMAAWCWPTTPTPSW